MTIGANRIVYSDILPVVISRSSSYSTVLRGSCPFVILLYLYKSPSQRSACDCNKRTLYCIVRYKLYNKFTKKSKAHKSTAHVVGLQLLIVRLLCTTSRSGGDWALGDVTDIMPLRDKQWQCHAGDYSCADILCGRPPDLLILKPAHRLFLP